MGTRSHPEYTGCVVNHSTAPSPARGRPGVHASAVDRPGRSLTCQHGDVLLPLPVTGPLRLAALVTVAVSALLAASPAAMVPGVRAAEGAASDWEWPLRGPRMLVRPYIAPPTPYAAGHRGIDIGATDDARVFAPDDGIVHFAGVVVDRPVLSIQHRGGLLSSFEPVSTEMTAGDPVLRGEVVGVLQPGHCSKPCLHFGVRLHGEYLSPLNYLGGIPHSVLLPTRPLR